MVASSVFALGTVACSLVVSTSGLAGSADGTADAAADGPRVVEGGDIGSDGAPSEAVGRSITYRAAVVADQPLAYWRLGEPTGSPTAADAVAGGAAGAVQAGVTMGVPGVFGEGGDTAASFDGSKGAILLGEVFDFTGNVAYSLEAWVRPTVVDGSFRRVIDKQLSNTAGYRLHVRISGGMPAVACGRCKASGTCVDGTAVPVDFSKFVHVVCTYDGALASIYVDGLLAKTESLPDPILASTAPFRIGNQDSNGEGFVGAIDEVALYGKALAVERVNAHYRAARP
jgi:hypothetical protein